MVLTSKWTNDNTPIHPGFRTINLTMHPIRKGRW